MKWKKIFLALLFIGVMIQFIRPDMAPVPVDPKQTIEAVLPVPPAIDATLRRACYDCHSNESRWPWYSQISPVSWWLKGHVNHARAALNFSEFAALPKKKQIKRLDDACDQVKQGDMPLKVYLPMHPAAHLTDADRAALCTWFTSLK
jgi:Haem-binding domain